MIDQETFDAYQKRWEAVADLKRMEQQRETIEERWRKLNALLRMAAALDLQAVVDQQQEELARQRWNRLIVRYLDRVEGEGRS